MIGWLKRAFIRREIGKIEEKHPMVRKALDWFTDPAHPGRKRGIAAGAAVLSGLLRGLHAGLAQACEGQSITGYWCSADPTAWAGYVDTASALLQGLTHGADLTAVVFGLIGIIHARQRPVLKPIRVVGSVR